MLQVPGVPAVAEVGLMTALPVPVAAKAFAAKSDSTIASATVLIQRDERHFWYRAIKLVHRWKLSNRIVILL